MTDAHETITNFFYHVLNNCHSQHDRAPCLQVLYGLPHLSEMQRVYCTRAMDRRLQFIHQLGLPPPGPRAYAPAEEHAVPLGPIYTCIHS